ncbi:MAG: LysE family translocator [Flavobacteriales bacterium]|nr:LysE family translocator [Flavobacteriales bacterium]
METSIKEGIRAALLLDFGVFLSDVLYIYIALHFFSQRDSIMEHEHSITLVTGILLVFFGLYQFLGKKKKKAMHEPQHLIRTRSKDLRLFLKGFLINIINPTILLYWFGMIFVGFSKNAFTDNEMIMFLCAIMASFFSIDVLKIIGARQLKKVVTPEFMHHLNRAIGVILMLFGAVMMVKGMKLFA